MTRRSVTHMNLLTQIHGETAIWFLTASTLLHEIGVPLPITPVAMFFAARGIKSTSDLVAFTLAMVLATLVGNLFWFNGGRRHGVDVLRRLCRLSLTQEARIAHAERAFERWGPLALVLGRLVPGVTVVAPPLAGALGMSRLKFVALTCVGAALYSVGLLGAGIVFRDEMEAVLRSLDRMQLHLAVSLSLVFVGYLAWRWRRRSGLDATLSSARTATSER